MCANWTTGKMASGLDEVFGSFVAEARRLNSLPEIDAIEFDYSARHLASEIKISGVKVMMVQGHVYVGEKACLGSFDSKGEFGFKNLIKISNTQDKVENIDTFLHEMFHKWQHSDISAFQRAIAAGSFEKETVAFTKKVMAEAGIKSKSKEEE
jgi:hypothetical protein